MINLEKGDYVYYAQIFKPPIGTYNVIELKVHNISEEHEYFTGCEVNKSRQTYIFHFRDLDNIVFSNCDTASELVKEAEEKYGKVVRQKELVLEDE